MTTIVRETNLVIKIKQFISPGYPWKNGAKRIETTQEKLQKCIFYLIAKDPDLSNGVKIQQKFIFYFYFYYHLFMRLIRFDLFFLNPFDS